MGSIGLIASNSNLYHITSSPIFNKELVSCASIVTWFVGLVSTTRCMCVLCVGLQHVAGKFFTVVCGTRLGRVGGRRNPMVPQPIRDMVAVLTAYRSATD